MADETTTPAPGTGEATTPETATAPTSPTNHPAVLRKQMKAIERERETLKAQLAELQEKNKSEAEKAIESARKEAAKQTAEQYEKQIADLKRGNAIANAVARAGLDSDYVHIVRAKLEDVEDIEDLDAEVAKIIETASWGKAPARGGQPGAPASQGGASPDYPRGGQWDRDQIQELVQNGQYHKYRPQIEQAWREGKVLNTGNIVERRQRQAVK